MRRVWMVFAAVMICWGVQAQEGFDAKMRRAGLVDVLAVDSTLRVKLMYSALPTVKVRFRIAELFSAHPQLTD